MQANRLATLVSVACLLSGCGFVPPAPPAPSDSGRVKINQADPRTVLPGKTPTMVASTAFPVPEAPPKSEGPGSGPEPEPPPTSEISPPVASASDKVTAPSAKDKPPSPPDAARTTEAQATVAPAPVVTLDTTPQAEAAEPIVVAPPKQIWRISPQDGTVRQALVRWAAEANWTFGPDQWELTFDLPIQAPAEFEAESFQEATQTLSQAVAMTESPIRPCFYGNRVLRVVPFTRSCNRSPATQS